MPSFRGWSQIKNLTDDENIDEILMEDNQDLGLDDVQAHHRKKIIITSSEDEQEEEFDWDARPKSIGLFPSIVLFSEREEKIPELTDIDLEILAYYKLQKRGEENLELLSGFHIECSKEHFERSLVYGSALKYYEPKTENDLKILDYYKKVFSLGSRIIKVKEKKEEPVKTIKEENVLISETQTEEETTSHTPQVSTSTSSSDSNSTPHEEISPQQAEISHGIDEISETLDAISDSIVFLSESINEAGQPKNIPNEEHTQLLEQNSDFSKNPDKKTEIAFQTIISTEEKEEEKIFTQKQSEKKTTTQENTKSTVGIKNEVQNKRLSSEINEKDLQAPEILILHYAPLLMEINKNLILDSKIEIPDCKPTSYY